MAMDPELKAKWVAALRSGEYKQGQGLLNNNERMCCLGVLCEVMQQPKKVSAGGVAQYLFPLVYGSVTFIPEVVCNEIGLGYKNANDLAVYNDTGKSFDFIASNIENRKTI